MKSLIKAAAGRIATVVAWTMAVLPPRLLGRLMADAAARRAASLGPADALRFLFRLDGELYRLEGRKAVEYDGGVHTKHRHIKYHEFFVERIGRQDRVLDVGCGKGELAFDIASSTGAKVVGIDLSSENISKASQNYSHPGIEFRVGDVLEDPLSKGFDVIVLSNVLEHLCDRPAFLQRLHHLVEASRFLIRVPLFERDWRVPLKREIGVEWRLDPTHEIEYTLESFDEELQAGGLSITTREVRWGEIWAEGVVDGPA